LLAPLEDRRLDPRRSTPAAVNAALVLFWTRQPSLNALAQIHAPRFWKQWLREPLASAATPPTPRHSLTCPFCPRKICP